MEHNYLDDIIRRKLENVPPPEEGRWEALEERLEAETDGSSFDALLGSRLKGAGLPAGLRGWERLEKSLDLQDREQQAAEQFDRIIHHKLRRASAGDPGKTWALMEEKLQRLAARRAGIYRAKILESLALLLLVFLTGKLIEQSPSPPAGPETAVAERTFSQTPSERDASNLPPTAGITDEAEPSSEYPQAAPPALPSESGNAPAKLQPLPISAAELEVPARIPAIADFHPAAPSGYTSFGKLDPAFSGLPFGLRAVSADPLQKKRSDLTFCLGILSTVNYNLISSPYDSDLNSQSYRRYEVGYGGGLQVAFLRKRWEVATAMVYSLKRYAPRTTEEVVEGGMGEDLYTDGLRKIELNVLSMPLHLKYRFLQKGRWSAYGLAGGAMHVVLASSYDRSQPIPDNRFLPPSFVPEARPVPDNFPEPSRISQKEFNEGLFEGGNFRENSFITLNAGLGMEYKASAELGLFAEPFFQQLLLNKTLGPTRDRISTFSIHLGARLHIK